MDKISIVVPVYNVKQYLRRCVISIENQTYKNVEMMALRMEVVIFAIIFVTRE